MGLQRDADGIDARKMPDGTDTGRLEGFGRDSSDAPQHPNDRISPEALHVG